MALLCLPPELLLLVADHLERQKDINSFARTCVYLHNVLDAYLYQYNVKLENDSALWWAVRKGQKTTARKSIAAGVNVNKRSTFDVPLGLAAGLGDLAMVELILSVKDVDPNARDYLGRSPLFLAAQGNQLAVVELLLATPGVDPDADCHNRYTPLLAATLEGHCEVVKLLLATVAVESCRAGIGETSLSIALSMAITTRRTAVVEALLATGTVGPYGPIHLSGTELLRALSRGDEAIAKLLLEAGADPEPNNIHDGRTPLMLAIELGFTDIVKMLLATGQVEIDSQDNRGNTPLFLAALHEKQELVDILLATGRITKQMKAQVRLSIRAENERRKRKGCFKPIRVNFSQKT